MSHPKLLGSSVEALASRVTFLRGLGLSERQVAHIVTKLPKVVDGPKGAGEGMLQHADTEGRK